MASNILKHILFKPKKKERKKKNFWSINSNTIYSYFYVNTQLSGYRIICNF